MTKAQKLNTISSTRVFVRGCVFALFVAALLTALSCPVQADMLVFWNFDSATDNVVTDSVHSVPLNLVNSSIVDSKLTANNGYAQGTLDNKGLALPKIGDTQLELPTGTSNYTLSAFLTSNRRDTVGIMAWGRRDRTGECNSFRTSNTTEGVGGLKSYWWGADVTITGYPEIYCGSENYVVTTGVGTMHYLYINGQFIGSGNTSARNEINQNFTVGNTVAGETLYGSIDNASVYNDAMDQKDIVNIAAHTYNGLTNWWKANETIDRVGGVVKPETVTGTTVISGTSGQVMVFNRELTAGEQAYYEGQLATGHDYVIDNMAGSSSTKTTWLRTSSADLSSATQTPLGIYVGGTTTASTLTATLDQINAVNRTVVMGGGTLALTLSGDASLDAYRVNFNSGSLSLSGSGELTLNSADKRVPLRNLAVAANTSFVVNTEKNVDIFGVISGAGNISLPANVTATFYNKSDHAFTGVLEAPKGGNLVLANQDVFNDSGYNGSYSLIADGTTITNSGAYFNYLTNVTLKNGAKIYAADGNSAWKAYKFLNLNVVRNSDNSSASLVTIDSNKSNGNTTISFAPQGNQVGSVTSTIYVEDITASSGSSDSLPDLTISAIITDPSINNNGATKANAIEKTGNGTLRLAAPNTFNGDLTITAGTVVMAANCNGSSTTATPLGNPSNADRKITVKSGAVLETESSNAGIDVFGGAEAHPKFTIVADGGTIATATNKLTTYGNIELKNNGVFEERGGEPTWLTIFNGDVSVTSGNATIQSTSSGRGISLRGYRDGTNAGVTFDVAENSTLDVSALLKDCNNRNVAGSFTKTGKGTMVLSNANNDFTGNIVIDEGTLKATTSWTGASGTTTVFGKKVNKTVTINEGAELIFTKQDVASNADAIYPIRFIVNGGTITNEGAVFNNLSNAEFYNGGKIVATNGNKDWKAFMVNGTTKIAFAGDGNTAESPVVFEVASTATGTAKTNATICPQTTFDVADITKSDASDFIVTAVLANASNRAGYFTKTGAGTMELSNNANSFTGNIVVDEGILKATKGWTGVGTGKNTTVFGYYQSKTITVNSGAEVILAAQDVVSNSNTSSPIQFIVDGGKISNEGAVYNNLNNTVFKNGGELYASNGNGDWKAYKLSTKVSVLRDKPSAQPVKITASDNGNATISFGHTTSLYVEDVTSASATELDTKSDLIISAKVTNSHNENNRTFYKDGVGTLEFTADNTFNGTVGVREGVLRLSGAGTLGTSAVNLVTNGTKHGTLEFKDSTATIPSAISGEGDLLVSSGTANLTGVIDQTGGSTILAGGTTLNLGSDTAAVNPTLNNLAVVDEDSSATLAVYGDLTLNNDQMSKFIGSITADAITKTGDETLKIYTGADGQVDAQSLVVSSGRAINLMCLQPLSLSN